MTTNERHDPPRLPPVEDVLQLAREARKPARMTMLRIDVAQPNQPLLMSRKPAQ